MLMKIAFYKFAAIASVYWLVCPWVVADDASRTGEFFERRIRPVLVRHCYECHSSGSDSLEGGLQLDYQEGLLQGGDSGPAVVPGRPGESPLLGALRHESFEMPPSGKLPETVIHDFERWVREGAHDPRDKPPSAADAAEEAWKSNLAQRSRWWSLQPPDSREPPRVDDARWMREPVDRFVRARLDATGLKPAPQAGPETLLRRLSFVLTGLPPDPRQVVDFRREWRGDPQAALGSLVDELLNSPHFGERFARHWMDVVRYTDTYGYEWDIPAKGSWEYRDYLIRAFNEDIGFDRLIREQLAGDLLSTPRISEQAGLNESLIGPMFFHLGERRHGSSLAFNGIHQEMVDSQIDAFSKAFLGMTVACARCHDHKLDAISQRDYYALAGVFMTPRWTSRVIDSPGKYRRQIAELRRVREEIRKELARIWLQHARDGGLGATALRRRIGERRPATESVLRPVAELLSRVDWLETEAASAEASAAETVLEVEEDGRTILASGQEVPLTDTYKIRFSTPPGDASLLRLEALTHESLGSRGPGRTAHGNFVLSRIRVDVTPRGEKTAKPVELNSARADYQQPNYPVGAAVEDSAVGWGVGLGGNLNRTARFLFTEPVSLPEGGDWTVTLDFRLGGGHSLGRFRLTPGIESSKGEVADEVILGNWRALAERWRTTRQKRVRHNAELTVLTDFSEPGLPDGWVAEGAGMEHGFARDGTPLIALQGEAVVERILERGYHTHALSSKLPAAVRAPNPKQLPWENIRVKIAGGQWAGRSVVPQNAFLNEGPRFFDPAKPPEWMPIEAPAKLKNGVTRVLTDFVTASLHPNFPPRTGVARMGGTALPDDDDGSHKRSRFSLLGIAADDEGKTPVDALDAFVPLYEGTPPESAGSAWSRVEDWLVEAVANFSEGNSSPGDVQVLNELLKAGWLPNSVEASPRLTALVERYRAVESGIGFARSVNSMDERGVAPIDYRVNIRGDVYDEGSPTPRDFLEVFAGRHEVRGAAGSGRLELANYLASRENPQTARVYVNRVWQWVFGAGLVATPNDFGKLGGRPSHPELLDWLAIRFMEEGWSTKRLVRRLVLGRVFRQSGEVSELGREKDPDNRLLHHYPTRRLESEAIRDSLLAASGRLDLTLYGRPIRPHRSAEDARKRLFSGPLDGRGRRSIYQQMSIMQPSEFLVGFNLPDLKFPCGRRDVTNVPAQALILLNDPFVKAMADCWAKRLVEDGRSRPDERIEAMFLAAFGRPPKDAERDRWLAAVRDFAAADDLMSDRDAWSTIAHAFFNAKEFIFYR